ncbi:efflux RND transporter periplasmic adaptor subunit [Actinoplanes sp. NPDC049265]|uniref:efflux RND transporter periplasmic adaptor subunit n=1 Tax=Actinoplanes sp. NPDC049265 TaxID=3363902 RepID=UPI003723921D
MRRGRLISGVVAGVVVLAVTGFFGVRALLGDKPEAAAATATATVDRGAVTAQVATTGTVEPAQTRSLSFTAAGTVASVKVRAGSVVTAGQVLAAIDDDDAAEAVDDARGNVASAQDALTDARAAADKAQTQVSTGCNVAAAAPAPTVRPAATTTRPAGTPPTGATPTGNPTASRPTGGATPQPRPSATTTAPACGTQRSDQSRQNAQGGQDGQGTQGGPGGDQIFSAQQRLHQAEKTLADAEDALDGTTITAPMAGRVLSVSGTVGSNVRAGTAFVTVAGSTMQISADFPEADAGRLAVRQKATVTPAGADGDLAATVVQVDPAGTSDGTMVRYGLVAAFDKAPPGLLIGQRAALKVTTGSAPDVLRVPSTAVHDVAGEQGTVLRGGARTKVGIGLRGDAYTEIVSGLTEGDVVARSW